MNGNITEPSIENLLLELKKRALAELVTDEAVYEELVDDLIGEKIEWGELNENDDCYTLREDLIGRWPDVSSYIHRSAAKSP